MDQQFIIGDSLVDTLLFDVISTSTKSVLKDKNGNTISPSIDFIAMPTGIGFKQTLDLVSGDTIDYVLKQTINKKDIKLTCYFKGENAYYKFQQFQTWIATYFDLDSYHIRLSYALGSAQRRYVEVASTDLELKGRDLNYVSAEITLKPLCPFYEETETSFIYHETNTGKIYNYTYPYKYGGGAYSDNNTIHNQFIKPLPLKIVIAGIVSSPLVTLTKINSDGSTESLPYAEVSIEGISIATGETLTIDAFNNKIFITDANGATTDVFDKVSKVYDAFLFAKSGDSKIACTLDGEGSKCTIMFVRYVL